MSDHRLTRDGTDTQVTTWPGAIACLCLVGVFAFVGGPVGAVFGIATVFVFVAGGVPYAIAAGTLLGAVALPVTGGLQLVVLVGGIGALALVPFLPSRGSFFVCLGTILAVGVLAWMTRDPLWVGSGVTLVTLVSVSYGLHRLGLVRLGLVTHGEPETDGELV